MQKLVLPSPRFGFTLVGHLNIHDLCTVGRVKGKASRVRMTRQTFCRYRLSKLCYLWLAPISQEILLLLLFFIFTSTLYINHFCHVMFVCHNGISSLEINKQHMIKIMLTLQSLLLWNCQLMLFSLFIFSGGLMLGIILVLIFVSFHFTTCQVTEGLWFMAGQRFF